MRGKSAPDYALLIFILALVTAGVVMVYSASFPLSLTRHGHGWFFALRQMLWAIAGIVALTIASYINYRKWQQASTVLLLATILLLLALYVPGVGFSVQGSTRWINLGLFNLQPSEIAKVTMVMWVAAFLARKADRLRSFTKGTMPVLLVTGLVAGLIFDQPDLGTAVAIVLVMCLVLFAGGLPWGQIISLGVLGIGLLAVGIKTADYRLERFMSFLNPWQDPLDTGYHIIQSLYAIGLGGIFGRGLGESIQKRFFLPEPHNDFIFAIISEEWGFIGGAVIIALFGAVAWRGLRIAARAPDKFSGLLATGLTSMIVSQAFINMGVVTGLMPVTGITLPFISYGGSSLLMVMGSAGVLLNISRFCRE
ncbi:MAG: putative lipid II flippase FtsW [Thermaerobacter sp.]|nr:putative lipid II flippase FtsW [Thermaerobacter sp.]MBS4055564.1 putative lipid II flippase FtsW [Thermaerobacter sp.]